MTDKYYQGDNVLLVWSNQLNESCLNTFVNLIKKKIGEQGKVLVENIFQLYNHSHPSSYFNVIEFGFIDVESKLQSITNDFLKEFLRILKPKGKMYIKLSNNEEYSVQNIVQNFKFAGFVNLEQIADSILCEKPNYEIGSKIDIQSNQEILAVDTQKAWKLATEYLLNDNELIDDNTLLTEEDVKKPDDQSLRVCGSTGKRKACSNCTCGLAEDLENEEKQKMKANKSNVKSACGNCYLGDAFRCASCPYLGMPAFKQGEKIVLNNFSDL